MNRVYVTGAVDDYDAPHEELIDGLSSDYPDVEWINPYDLNDFSMGDDGVYERPHEVVEPALSEIDLVDGVLVVWEDDAFLVGTVIEIWEAHKRGIPVSIYYSGWRDNLSPWLLYSQMGTYGSLETAVKTLLMVIGESDVL